MDGFTVDHEWPRLKIVSLDCSCKTRTNLIQVTLKPVMAGIGKVTFVRDGWNSTAVVMFLSLLFSFNPAPLHLPRNTENPTRR